MEAKQLVAVEKWTLAFAAFVVAFALLTLRGRMAFGVSVGAALVSLNAWSIQKLGQASKQGLKARLVLASLKTMAMLGLVFVLLYFLRIDPIGFIIGISVFPAAIVAVAIRHALRSETDSEETHG
jgi:hypothetical protein